MTAIPPTPPEPPDRLRVLIDFLALALILAGAAMVVYGAWELSREVGLVVTGAAVLAGGIILGTGRDDE